MPRLPGRPLLTGWLRRAALLLPPTLACLAAVLLLGDWIIDDAGISYAYARNLALGHGLVSAAGRAPVEGYSNFLWVLLLAPFRLIGLFDPIVTPKALGFGLLLAAWVILQRTFERHTGRWAPGLFASLWIAAAPPIAIWTTSGLENSLTVLLVVALWACVVERGPWWRARSGLLAALAAMTRPDGLQYLGFAALAALHDGFRGRRDGAAAGPAGSAGGIAGAARGLLGCVAGFLVLFGPFFALRLLTFGRPWPQPYYAKRAYPSLGAELADFARHPGLVMERVLDLGRAVAEREGLWILGATLIALAALAWTRRLPRHLAVGAWLLVVALAGFVLMDRDWMGEYRFASGAIAALAIAVGGMLFSLGEASDGRSLPGREPRPRRWVAIAVAGTLGLIVLADAGPRILSFAKCPPTPYRDVQDRVAGRFAAYAGLLGIQQASILAQDVGAVLDLGRLRVHDVTGLVDPEAAHTLRNAAAAWRYEHPEFYDWVFDRIRPTFISTHGHWVVYPMFEFDPRFVRDYAAIEAHPGAHILERRRIVLHPGDYVRRDVLKDAGDVERMRAGYRADPRRPTPAWRFVDAWIRRGTRDPSLGELREAAKVAEAGKDADRAAVLYGSVLKREPDDETALRGLARSLDRVGRAYEARPVWTRLREMERAKGSSADTLLVSFLRDRLGDGRHRLPASAAAIAQWMRIGRRTLDRDHDPDAAIRLFREVLAADPAHPGATAELARARGPEPAAAVRP